jgi:hypothetical protein
MRRTRLIPVLGLAALLALPACTGQAAPGSAEQDGDPTLRGAGQTPERGAASAARDTTPHRPGAGTDQEP